MQQTLWWTKSRRAQNTEDFETWLQGGVTPTLNAFDNANENRATVLIIDGTRVGDVRVYEDQVMQTVIQRWGTGGGNVPMIFDNEPTAYSIREDAKADNFSATETEIALALQANQPSVQSHHAQIFIAQDEPIVMRDREGCAGGAKGRYCPTRLSRWHRAIFILFSLTPRLFADSHRLSVSDCKAFPMAGLPSKPIPIAISRWATR
jgi:hypothetical protein